MSMSIVMTQVKCNYSDNIIIVTFTATKGVGGRNSAGVTSVCLIISFLLFAFHPYMLSN